MNINQFAARNWFAWLLVALHSLLVGAYAWIELDNAWNDMNPTMLVMVGLHVIDYPIHVILQPLIDNVEQTGTYLAATLALGGTFWFGVGSIITFAARMLHHIMLGYRPATNGT
jgi:uncharacterized membrane protein